MKREPSELPPTRDPDAPEVLPGPLAGGPDPLAYKSRRKRTLVRRALHGALALVGSVLFRVLWSTYRLRVVSGKEHLARYRADKQPYVICCWHDQAYVCVWWLMLRVPRPSPLLFLVSPSLDGDPVTRLIERMGGRVVRGSATRSAIKSLRALYRLMRAESYCPVIVPDGPRGPAHECKNGALMLAQLAGRPVLPVACSVRWAWRAWTWDRGQMALPFARIAIAVGEPIAVAKDATGVDIAEQSLELGSRLDELTVRAGT